MAELVPIDAPATPVALRNIDGLDARALERIGRAPADNTLRAYRRHLREYTAWSALRGVEPIPATGATFANYVTALADNGRGVTVIKQAMSAIRWAHALAGHDDQPPLKLARLALRDHARERAETGDRGDGPATPILLDTLRAMLDTCSPDSFRGRRDRWLLVIGWAGMLRRSELAALTFPNVTPSGAGLTLYIATSKTDQEAEGTTVLLPQGSHPETDPVRVHATYLDALAAQGITSGALPRHVGRGGRVGGRITGEQINYAVQSAARRAHLPGLEGYSAHSLRAGGATAAYHNGAPVSAIAEHGRWAKNSPVVLGYIRAVDKWKDNPMRGIGL